MPYPRLALTDTKFNAAISMATEGHLEQAHYLLATTYPNVNSPRDHFGTSAVIMTLLAIAAAAAIRNFDLKSNRQTGSDRAAFVGCVLEFFPWKHVSVDDDQHRP